MVSCGTLLQNPNPQKEKYERQNQVRFNEKFDNACDNDINNSDQKIYSPMACMSGNDECLSKFSGDSLQLTNWIWIME